jgi:hypothetical protein
MSVNRYNPTRTTDLNPTRAVQSAKQASEITCNLSLAEAMFASNSMKFPVCHRKRLEPAFEWA